MWWYEYSLAKRVVNDDDKSIKDSKNTSVSLKSMIAEELEGS